MQKLFMLLFTAVIFSSCDDGDIIVTDFEFESDDLEYCNIGSANLLYKIDNDNDKTLSLSFSNANFAGGTIDELEDAEPTEITLEGNNLILYRTYDGPVPASYFCTSVPPSEPQVTEEYRSTGGLVTFHTSVVSQDDGDGVSDEEEDLNNDGNGFNDDTDQDGIPDFLDIDDDGDGIPTAIEIINPNPESDEYPDTDQDGVPNYLDPDDDGDGVLSINEDADLDGNPTNDDADGDDIPNYLDSDSAEEYDAYELPENTIPRRFRTVVRITNLTMTNGEETITEANTFEYGIFTTGVIQYTIFPD